MDDRQVAITSVGTEGELLIGIKSVRVHAFADGWRGNHLAAIGIHHSHHLVVAASKQPAMLLVHGQPARFLARGQRPAFYHDSLFSVDAGYFTLVFNVYKNPAFTVSHAKFRFAVEWNIPDNLVVRGIDYRGIFAAAVEGENPLGRWIIKNGIRIFAVDLNFGRLLQCFQVKDRYTVVATVAGESLAQILGNSNPVDPGCVRNVADD